MKKKLLTQRNDKFLILKKELFEYEKRINEIDKSFCSELRNLHAQ